MNNIIDLTKSSYDTIAPDLTYQYQNYSSKNTLVGGNDVLSDIPELSGNFRTKEEEEEWKECVKQFSMWMMQLNEETFGSDRYNAEW